MHKSIRLFILLAYSGNARTDDLVADLGGIKHLYVSTIGSDFNSGSHSSPFRTIQFAADRVRPGTTVHVAPGTYNENVQTNIQGRVTARIRFLSEIKWGAKIIGRGTESMWMNNGSYTDIVNFDISGSGRLGILNLASWTTISGNHVHNLAVSGGCTANGGAGINNANYAGSNDDIEGNVVHDIGVPGSCSLVHGIYSSNFYSKINNNIIYRVSAFGIHLWHAARNVVIANNTVFSNGAGGIGGGIIMGSGDVQGFVILDNIKVINNIIYGNPAASIKEYCYTGKKCIGTNNIIANNLVYDNGSEISLQIGTASGTIRADPQFVDYQTNGRGNYHLKITSPAINAGLSTDAPLIDIDDTVRPRGAAPDIGAYEDF